MVDEAESKVPSRDGFCLGEAESKLISAILQVTRGSWR